MKCTECSKELRPVVAVDIDGTLGEYHSYFHEFAQMYVGRQLPSDYGGGNEFSGHLILPKEEYRQIKLAYRQGGMKRSMPTFPGAQHYMEMLREMDVEIWIATTRPYMRLDNIDPDTRHWLDRNGIPWDYMIYGDEKYEEMLASVDKDRVLYVVDDLREQCQIASDLGLRAIQPMREHNRNDRWRDGFYKFSVLEQQTKEMLDGWRHAHS